MGSRATLRAVPDAERAAKPAAPARKRGRPRTVLANAVDLDEREMLCVLRRKIAKQLDEGVRPASAFAAVLRQYREVDRQIRAIDEAAASLADDDYDDDDDEAFDPSEV